MWSPDYGTISILLDSPQPGDTVRFTCDDGYELIGSEVRTCLDTDVWSGEAVSCQGIMVNPHTYIATKYVCIIVSYLSMLSYPI